MSTSGHFGAGRFVIEEEGAKGLADQRLDRVAHNAAPVDEVMALVSLYKTYYRNWNVNHFYDQCG